MGLTPAPGVPRDDGGARELTPDEIVADIEAMKPRNRKVTIYQSWPRMILERERKRAALPAAPAEACIFEGCVSTDRHWHGGFPGGYNNPDDPDGPPIPFTSEPEPGVRDYNWALLAPAEAGLRERIGSVLHDALVVADQPRARMRRYELGMNGDDDSFHIAATDRTALIMQLDRALDRVKRQGALAKPTPAPGVPRHEHRFDRIATAPFTDYYSDACECGVTVGEDVAVRARHSECPECGAEIRMCLHFADSFRFLQQQAEAAASGLDVPRETAATLRCTTHHACPCHERLAEIGRRYLEASGGE